MDDVVTASVTHKGPPNYLVWIIVFTTNSFFEEGIYVGYLYKRLERYNRGIFLVVTTALRIIIHLYQGLGNVVMHAMVAVIFGTYYIGYRKLAPLIIVHTILNLITLFR